MGLTAAPSSPPWKPMVQPKTVAAVAAADAGNAESHPHSRARLHRRWRRIPRAVAFAVKNRRFIAVGANEEIEGLDGQDTLTIYAKQMTCGDSASPIAITMRRRVLLYEVLVGNPFSRSIRHDPPASSTSFARRRGRVSRHVGVGLLLRDTQVKDRRELNVHTSTEVVAPALPSWYASWLATRRTTTALRSRWQVSPRTPGTRRWHLRARRKGRVTGA